MKQQASSFKLDLGDLINFYCHLRCQIVPPISDYSTPEEYVVRYVFLDKVSAPDRFTSNLDELSMAQISTIFLSTPASCSSTVNGCPTNSAKRLNRQPQAPRRSRRTPGLASRRATASSRGRAPKTARNARCHCRIAGQPHQCSMIRIYSRSARERQNNPWDPGTGTPPCCRRRQWSPAAIGPGCASSRALVPGASSDRGCGR